MTQGTRKHPLLQSYLVEGGTRWMYSGPPWICRECGRDKAKCRFGTNGTKNVEDVHAKDITWHVGTFCNVQCYLEYHVETKFPSAYVSTTPTGRVTFNL